MATTEFLFENLLKQHNSMMLVVPGILPTCKVINPAPVFSSFLGIYGTHSKAATLAI